MWKRIALYACYTLIGAGGLVSLLFHPPNSIEVVAPAWERIVWEFELMSGAVICLYGMLLGVRLLYSWGVALTTCGLFMYVIALATRESWTLACLVSALGVLGIGEVLEAFSGRRGGTGKSNKSHGDTHSRGRHLRASTPLHSKEDPVN